ncbi:hypothetical protein cypCar_00025528 [Cyprinus carpio]|nr:hypothetical protein cypCar_00025528 [Cyprinus carpio]
MWKISGGSAHPGVCAINIYFVVCYVFALNNTILYVFSPSSLRLSQLHPLPDVALSDRSRRLLSGFQRFGFGIRRRSCG